MIEETFLQKKITYLNDNLQQYGQKIYKIYECLRGNQLCNKKKCF